MSSLQRIGNYRLGKTLGVGSFGKVKLAEHEQTGKKVAVKILNRQKIRVQKMEEKLKREIKILKMCMHPHIIRLYEVIETPTDVFVVTEYSSGGELFDYIVERGRLAEHDARRFFQQIIAGVEYCHQHMVAHRDLKPENLLLDEHANVRLADFGLSNCMRDGWFLMTSCGSPNYAAPEVISGKLYAGPEVDVWSCGVILYALLCGTLPFDDESIPYLFRKIKGGIFILPSYLSEASKDIITRMLVTDPLKRITIAELRRHPWFCTNLPRYLAFTPPVGHHLEHIDDHVLTDVVALTGFPRDKIAKALRKGRRNHYTVAYHLIKDANDSLDTSIVTNIPYAHANSMVAAAALQQQQQQQQQHQHHQQAHGQSVPGDVMQPDPRAAPRGVVVNTHPSPGPGGGPRVVANPPGAMPGQQQPGCPPSGYPMPPGSSALPLITAPGGGVPRTPTPTGPANGPSSAGGPTDMVLQTPVLNEQSAPGAGPGAPTTGPGGAHAMHGVPTLPPGAGGKYDDSLMPSSDLLRFVPERRWNVGIVTNRTDPADFMMEVYSTLHRLQWRWKTPSNQAFQVRVLVNRTGFTRPVRLCLQLFKTSSGFNLDIHRLDGDMIPFLAVCAELTREIR